MKTPFLAGQNVYLRAHTEDDLPVWTEWFNDSQVTQYLGHGYVPNVIEVQKMRLGNMGNNPSSIHLAIVAKENDKLVGTLTLGSIHLAHRHAEISILIGDRASWGKGYAKQALALILEHAFDKLNLHKVVAGAIEENVPSVRLFESLGFAREAVFVEHFYHVGKFQNAIRFALFKRDWKK